MFLTVARTGRVSVAAKRLNVEHTTVARRLTALEADLGVPLFYRTKSGYLLTSNGQRIVAKAEAMERAATAATARAREASVAGGRVRLAMPPEFASHWVAPNLATFRTQHPQVEMQILVGTRQRDLSRGEADLALQEAQPRQTGMVSFKIGRLEIGLYAVKSLLGNGRFRVVSADTLRGVSLLAYSPEFRTLQSAKWFQSVLSAASVALTTNSTEAILAATRAGAGIGVLPRFVARRYDELIAVSENVAEPDLLVVTHPELRRDPKVRATIDFVKELARQPGLA